MRESTIVEDRSGGWVGGIDCYGATAERLEDDDGNGIATAKGDFLNGSLWRGVEIKNKVTLSFVAG